MCKLEISQFSEITAISYIYTKNAKYNKKKKIEIKRVGEEIERKKENPFALQDIPKLIRNLHE